MSAMCRCNKTMKLRQMDNGTDAAAVLTGGLGRRRLGEKFIEGWIYLAGLLAIVVLLGIIILLVKEGVPIFFDTPPVIAVTDATVLSSMVDGAVLIVKSAETDREALKRAHTQLENVKAKVFGTLLNGVHMDDMFGSYYYYYYRQYYGDGKLKRGKRKKSIKEKLFT